MSEPVHDSPREVPSLVEFDRRLGEVERAIEAWSFEEARGLLIQVIRDYSDPSNELGDMHKARLLHLTIMVVRRTGGDEIDLMQPILASLTLALYELGTEHPLTQAIHCDVVEYFYDVPEMALQVLDLSIGTKITLHRIKVLSRLQRPNNHLLMNLLLQLEDAPDTDYDKIEAKRMYGVALRQQGELRASVQVLRSAHKAALQVYGDKPFPKIIETELGFSLLQMGSYQEAKTHFENCQEGIRHVCSKDHVQRVSTALNFLRRSGAGL